MNKAVAVEIQSIKLLIVDLVQTIRNEFESEFQKIAMNILNF